MLVNRRRLVFPMRYRPSSNGDRAAPHFLGYLDACPGWMVASLDSTLLDMPASPHGVAETQIIRGRTGISFLLSDGHPSCFMVWFGAAQTIW